MNNNTTNKENVLIFDNDNGMNLDNSKNNNELLYKNYNNKMKLKMKTSTKIKNKIKTLFSRVGTQKNMLRLALLLLIGSIFLLMRGFVFAESYQYFYGDGCPHCTNVKEYFDKNEIMKKYDVVKKEVWFNKANSKIYMELAKKMWIPFKEIGVPFMVINKDDGTLEEKRGDGPIIDYFRVLEGDNAGVIKDKQNLKKKRIIALFIVIAVIWFVGVGLLLKRKKEKEEYHK